MSWGRRLVMFPVVRIVLAAAPIVVFLAVAQKLLAPLRLSGNPLGGAVMAVVFGGSALLLYAGYVRVVERRRIDELGLRGALGEAARGFVVGTSLFAATMAILLVAGHCTVVRGDGWRALAYGFAAALGAALVEETLLRAIFFRIVEESLGTAIAVTLSAGLFGFLHAFNPGATIVSTIAIALEAGVILAAAYVLTRRLWMAIGLHAGWNFTEGGLFGASVSGTSAHGLLSSRFSGPTLLSGGAFGPEASIVAVAVCLTVGVVLLAAARRRGHLVRPFWLR